MESEDGKNIQQKITCGALRDVSYSFEVPVVAGIPVLVEWCDKKYRSRRSETFLMNVFPSSRCLSLSGNPAAEFI